MEMTVVDLDPHTRKIALSGRLDTAGVGAVELRFTALAAKAGRTIVDLGQVSFLASMGIRMLVSCAKGAAGRGGRIVLVAPQPLVNQTLRDTGVNLILPIAADEAQAREILAT